MTTTEQRIAALEAEVAVRQELDELRAEITRFTEVLQGVGLRALVLDAEYERGFREGLAARGATPGRKPRTRPSHLQAIAGGAS